MDGKVVVGGGGIAGLAVARGLVRGGRQVEVRERLSGPSDIGGALGMWPTAMAALDRLGLGQEIRARTEYRAGGVLLRPTAPLCSRSQLGAGFTWCPGRHCSTPWSPPCPKAWSGGTHPSPQTSPDKASPRSVRVPT